MVTSLESLSLKLQDGKVSPFYSLQCALCGWRSLRQSCCDIRLRNIHGCFGVDGHSTCFLSYPSHGVQILVAVHTQHADFITRGLEWWNHRLLRFFAPYSLIQSLCFSWGVFLGVFLAEVPRNMSDTSTLPADGLFRSALLCD